MKCSRCNKETDKFTMSMFNEDMICMDCKEKERNHKDYDKARQADYEQIRQGNYNFQGIGKPSDL